MDCQHLILEQSPVIDLVSMAQTNKNAFHLVRNILRHRFSKKLIVFHLIYYSNKPNMMELDWYQHEFDDRIEISHMPIIQKILQYFGQFITKLHISHTSRMPKMQSQRIYQFVNLYCSNTLVQLQITNHFNDIFAEFKKPFKNVTIVSLDGNFGSFENSTLTFSQLFPSLNCLNLGTTDIHHLNVDHQRMPFLEYLIADNGHQYRTNSLKMLIKNNPQIRSIALKAAKPDLLQFIADRLPYLEHLILDCYEERSNIGNMQFHFERLKSFVLMGTTYTMPSNVIFGSKLEEFEVRAKDRDSSMFVELILKHRQTLKKLRLHVALNNVDISRLANACLTVDELQFKCKVGIDIENVIKLIANIKRLKKLVLHFEEENARNLAFGMLQNRFSREWNLSNRGHHIYLSEH